MHKLFTIIFAIIVIGSSATTTGTEIEENNKMKNLTIRWQRLVYGNTQTCQRCDSTGKEVQKAFHSLKESLTPLGIKVILEKKALDAETCAKDISQSNRIWVGGRPLEEWLNAQVGQSPCATCCAGIGSDVECRAVQVEGQTYETIPSELIIKAGLLAASQLLTPGLSEPCGESKTSAEIPSSGCCAKPDSINQKIDHDQ